MSQTETILRDHLVGAAEIIDHGSYLSFKRVPSWTEAKHGHNPMATDVSSQGSGVRFEFKTTAKSVTLTLAFERVLFPGLPELPAMLVCESNGKSQNFTMKNVLFKQIFPGGPEGELTFSDLEISLGDDSASKVVKIWLPHDAQTYISKVHLDAEVTEHQPEQLKWVHYGSSISHCKEAELPTGAWPVIASKNLGLNLINLGLAGNAMLEPYMVDVILKHNPDVVSLKIGINSINAASHTLRTFMPAAHGLIEDLLEKKPDLKILVIDPIICPPHEEGFGPTVFDVVQRKATANPNPNPEMYPANLNTQRVRKALKDVVANLQSQGLSVSHLSGLDLMGPEDVHYLEDDLHPNSAGYAVIGERFANHPTVKQWLAS